MQVPLGICIGRETYGSSNLKRNYVQSLTDKERIIVTNEHLRSASVASFFQLYFRASILSIQRLPEILGKTRPAEMSVFLPQGYPTSVSKDYTQYQIWDTIQAFASSITGALAAQGVLKGIGVGNENATVLAATMTWLIKDGTGMLGRILFAWFQGSNLDCDAKRWRLFADVLNDLAIFIEILAPNFPPFFTFMVCTAGIFKSIVGVAGGATRAALTQHQARRNNMADVSAKDGSQETVVNLAALLCNLVLVPLVTGKVWLIWTLYMVFTTLHLFANYSAVTCVVMETFNRARFHILVQEYFRSNNVLPPASVNFREPVLWATRRKLQINLGSSLQNKCKSIEDVKILQDVFEGSQYLLGVDFKKGQIHIVLHKNCTIEDQLNACYQAELVEYAWLHRTSLSQVKNTELQLLIKALKEENIKDILAISYQYARKTFHDVKSAVESMGWQTDIALLGADEWRAEWDFTTGLSDKKEM